MVDHKELRNRVATLEAERSSVEEQWQAIEKFVTPYRGDFYDDDSGENTVEWNKRHIYDSTAVNAHQTLAAAIHGALTSPSIRWFNLRYRDETLNKNQAATKWLQDVETAVFFELQDSNFDLEVNEVYQDVAGFGTAFMLLEEGEQTATQWGGLNFKSLPLKQCFFEEDVDGIARFYRKFKWTGTQIFSKFGESVPDKITENEPQREWEVVYAVYPTGNKAANLFKKQNKNKRPYEACYFLYDCATQLGDTLSYYEMPVMSPRWRKTSESMWGNSPAMVAMGDILTLNHSRKLQLLAAEKMVDPPIFAEERSIIGDLDLSSASLSVVRNIDGIRAFGTTGNIPVSDMIITQLQESIRETFFTSQLMFPPTQGTPMSATEAQIRYEQLQKMLGPTLGRLRKDMLDRVVERAFRMLARKGMLPEPPQVVLEQDPDFDVQYTGALSRAQSGDSAASIERWAMMAGQIGQFIPGTIDVVDPVKVMTQLGRDLNIPADLYRSEDEIEQINQERQQAMQAAQAQAEGEAMQAMGAGQQALAGEGEQ